VKLTANTPQKVNHKLNTKKLKVIVTGVEGQVIPVKVEYIDNNSINITPQADASQAMLSVTGKPGDQSLFKDILDVTTRMLIGIQNFSGTYTLTGGTILPGYLPEPTFFGGGNYEPNPAFGYNAPPSYAPGLPFLLGW
jgi:hypothetical protein